MLNDWNPKEVTRAENTWGHKIHPYTKDLFQFATETGDSWLDLGCGFGRFLEYLDGKFEEADYIGYDSSASMIARICERFPAYALRCFHKDITEPISHPKQVVISSAVFIHITLESQNKILKNLTEIHPKPLGIGFDINCPSEGALDKMERRGVEANERRIKTTKDGSATFRMTWQNHRVMLKKLKELFPDYDINFEFYPLRANQHKVMFFLKRR